MGERRVNWPARLAIYFAGLLFLAVGVVLSTMIDMGVSCITSVPFSVSRAFHMSYSRAVLFVYAVVIPVELLLKGKRRRWTDLLQIPFTFVFSALLRVIELFIHPHPQLLWQKLVLLALAIVFIAAGMCLMVPMKLVSNPPDALAEAIGVALGKDMGFGKNILDAAFVLISVGIDLIFSRRLISLGVGTAISMVMVGRTVALFDRLLLARLLRWAGLTQTV